MKNKIKNFLLASAITVSAMGFASACASVDYVDVPYMVPEEREVIVEKEYDVYDQDTPAYLWERQAAFGENPDLDEMLINGKRDEGEGWEDQKYYRTSTSESPYVSFEITTKFSDKGLYVFAEASDGAKLAWSGRNYIFRNSNFDFYITGPATSTYNDKDVKRLRIDTNCMYPSITRAKVGIHSTNEPDSVPDRFSVEIFITWSELNLSNRPKTVRIFPTYNYKYSSSDQRTTALSSMFNGGYIGFDSYVRFDDGGYVNGDAENAALGDSYFGVGKTMGWDISHERDAFPYVTPVSSGTQAIFFNKPLGRNFTVETELDITDSSADGRAGIIFYLTDKRYLTFLAYKDSNTVSGKSFNSIVTKMRWVNGGVPTNVDFATVEETGTAKLKIINSQGKLYFIVGSTLVYCVTNNSLSDRMSVGLCAIGMQGVKFINSRAEAFSRDEINSVALDYAYGLSAEADRNIAVKFNTEAVKKDSLTNSVDISVTPARAVTLTTANFESLYAGKPTEPVSADFDSDADYQSALTRYQTDLKNYNDAKANLGDKLFRIKSVIAEITTKSATGAVNTATRDLTEMFATRSKEGVLNYRGIEGSTLFKVSSEKTDPDSFAIVSVTLGDKTTLKKISGSPQARVRSTTNGYLGDYSIGGRSGRLVFAAEKGHAYTVEITTADYRKILIDCGTVNEDTVLGDDFIEVDGVSTKAVMLTANVFGGIATCEDRTKSGLSLASSAGTWDYSHESEGYALFETNQHSSGVAYFTGYTVDRAQVAEFTVRNTTIAANYDKYEPDPAVGFTITTDKGGAFVGFRYGGLRVLQRTDKFEPTQIDCGLGQTVNLVSGKPFNGTWSLKMVRIDEHAYIYARKNKEPYAYIAHVVFTKGRTAGYAGIGINVTVSYGMSLTLSDYGIQTGFEAAKAIALEDFAAQLKLDESCKVGDKDLITVDGLYDFDANDGVKDDILFDGNEATVSLNTDIISSSDLDSKIYIVKFGSQQVYLSKNNPTATVKLEKGNYGVLNVSTTVDQIASIYGSVKVYKDGSDITSSLPLGTLKTLKGYIVNSDGAKIPANLSVAGQAGAYALTYDAAVKADETYDVFFEGEGFCVGSVNVNVPAGAGSVKGGDIIVADAPLGGSIVFNGRTYSSTGVASIGTDNAEYGIDGLYMEVNNKDGNVLQVFNDDTYSDFVLRFSYLRVRSADGTDETDAGVGIALDKAGSLEQVLFIKNGIRTIPLGGAVLSGINLNGISPVNLQNLDGGKYDFMIVRRGDTFYMYAKPASAEDWTHVYTYESPTSLGRCVIKSSVSAMGGKTLHYFLYNVSMKPLGENVAEEAIKTVNVTSSAGGTITVSGGHKTTSNQDYYIIGDRLTITATPASGKVLAYVRVNGKPVIIPGNEYVKVIDGDEEIEVVFEDVSTTADVSLGVRYGENFASRTLDTVDVYAEYVADGRVFEFKNVKVNNGLAKVALRDGEYRAYVNAGTLTTLYGEFTVSGGTLTAPVTFTLDVMSQGAVNLNGVSAKTTTFREDSIHTNGGIQAKDRAGSAFWSLLPDTINSASSFYFETKVTMSGGTVSANGSDPYFSNDNVTGIVLSNGSAQMVYMFWGKSLRISRSYWDNTGWMNTLTYSDVNLFNSGSSAVTSHRIGLGRYNDRLYITIDGKVVGIMDGVSGTTLPEGSTLANTGANGAADDNLKGVTASLLSSDQLVLGFSVNLNLTVDTNHNNALFSDTVFTTDEAKVKTAIGV